MGCITCVHDVIRRTVALVGQTEILLALSALFFLGAVAIGIVVFLRYRRPRTKRTVRPAARPAPVTPPAAVGLDRLPNLPVDAAYDEEEMPTVIVSQGPRVSAPAASAPRRSGRTSGATIIAFDDEDDED